MSLLFGLVRSGSGLLHAAVRYLALLLAAGVCLAEIATGVTFQFDYIDAPGTGFNDSSSGYLRRTALEYAGSLLENVLTSSYSGETIVVQASYTDQDGPLATGGPSGTWHDFSGAVGSTIYGSPLANHLALQDLGPALPDARIRVNTDFADAYYYGIGGGPTSDQFDFITVALHEIVHGLSFGSAIDEDGFFEGSLPSIYDQFVTIGPQGPSFASLPPIQRADALISGNLFWGGTAGIAGNGTAPKLEAPPTYSTSSLSHLDQATMASFLMSPSLAPGTQTRFLSPAEIGMLQDMGWTFDLTVNTVTWSGLGADNHWTTTANWIGGAEPQNGDAVAFGTSPQTDVLVEYGLDSRRFLQSIAFNSDAPQHTLHLQTDTATEFLGAGFTNASSATHTVILNSFADNPAATDGANLLFHNSSSAGNLNYLLRGDITFNPGGANEQLQRHGIARIYFNNSSNAGTASFDLEGGGGDGAFGGVLDFYASASAANSMIRNRASRLGASSPIGTLEQGFSAATHFHGSATAATATITNEGGDALSGAGSVGGITQFHETATAGSSTITNRGADATQGIGGRTTFGGTATAGSASIANESARVAAGEFSPGFTDFFENSTAGTAMIDNQGSDSASFLGGITRFREDSSAGNATIHNRGSDSVLFASGGVTEFRDASIAGNATIRNYPSGWSPGRTEFHEFASAGMATINIEPVTVGVGGSVYFYDDSTAANANISMHPASSSSTIRFEQQASGGNAHLEILPGAPGRIEFIGTSTAQNSTIVVGSTGILSFLDYSTAAFANIDIGANATSQFNGGFNLPGNYSVSAGSAAIVVRGGGSPGILDFNANSTAGSALIGVEGGNGPGTLGGIVTFTVDSSTAGSSTILAVAGQNGAPGGRVTLRSGAKADMATIITQLGAVVDISGNQFFGGTSIGSLVGVAGTVVLEHSHLNIGGLGLNGAYFGEIIDLNPAAGTGGTLTKIGAGTVTLGGDNTYGGVTTVAQGRLNIDGSILGGAVVQSGATLGGIGTMTGGVIVLPGGNFAPGTSPGTITVDDLTLENGSQVLFELGTVSDHIVVNGNLQLGGSLELAFLDGFLPTMGQSFTLFSGTFGTPVGQFAEITLPTGVEQDLQVQYNAGLITLSALSDPSLLADFDSDGDVDGNDFLLWQRNPTVGSLADWQASYGTTLSSLTAAAEAVPEPSGLICCTVIACCVAMRRPQNSVPYGE